MKRTLCSAGLGGVRHGGRRRARLRGQADDRRAWSARQAQGRLEGVDPRLRASGRISAHGSRRGGPAEEPGARRTPAQPGGHGGRAEGGPGRGRLRPRLRRPEGRAPRRGPGERAPKHPTVLPTLYNPSPAGLSAAESAFQCVLKAPAKEKDYLAVVDEAMVRGQGKPRRAAEAVAGGGGADARDPRRRAGAAGLILGQPSRGPGRPPPKGGGDVGLGFSHLRGRPSGLSGIPSSPAT